MRQLEEGRAEVENQYSRAGQPRRQPRRRRRDGARSSRSSARRWRGIGDIADSGLGLRRAYRDFDAERRFGAVRVRATERTGECISGLVLRGEKKPPDCPAFGTRCTPEHPLGVTMVSSEGACAAYYRYRGADRRKPCMTRCAFCQLSRLPATTTRRSSSPMAAAGAPWPRLLESVIRPAFDDAQLASPARRRGARHLAGRIAFTTDSYVVRPLFFPGGDIGTLAVNGTVNDLAMCGARPLYLSVGFILEEGLPIETLRRDRRLDAATAARAAGVRLVTGDTKVVDRGKARRHVRQHRRHRRDRARPRRSAGPACGRATP